MCGGFLGDVLGKIDPIFNKNNPWERKKRIANEQMAEADRKDAAAKQADLDAQTTGNQSVQAELVASRRRRAAQSLLASGNPFNQDDLGSGSSNLARGKAQGTRAPAPAAATLG